MRTIAKRQPVPPAGFGLAQSPRPDSADVPTFAVIRNRAAPGWAGLRRARGCNTGRCGCPPAGGNGSGWRAMVPSRGSCGQIRPLHIARGHQQAPRTLAHGAWAAHQAVRMQPRLCATSSTGPSASATVSSSRAVQSPRSGASSRAAPRAGSRAAAPSGFASGQGQSSASRAAARMLRGLITIIL